MKGCKFLGGSITINGRYHELRFREIGEIRPFSHFEGQPKSPIGKRILKLFLIFKKNFFRGIGLRNKDYARKNCSWKITEEGNGIQWIEWGVDSSNMDISGKIAFAYAATGS